jgi:PAS domain S-box-containing protein
MWEGYSAFTVNNALRTQVMINLLKNEERLEAALVSNQQLINTVLTAVNHIVIVLEGKLDDPNFFNRYTSSQYRDVFGADLPLKGDAPLLNQFLHPDDKDFLLESFKNQPFNEPLRMEFRVRHADGHYLWVETTLTKQYDSHQDVLIVYIVMRDITHEYELRETKRRLMQERELDAIKAYFITSVMHEFRTPLATILSSAEIIQRYRERLTEQRQEKHIQQIVEEVSHLRDVLDDLNIILGGRIEGMGFHPRRLDVTETFYELIIHFSGQIASPHRVGIMYSEGLDSAYLDPRLLRHIVMNLLRNAAIYSKSDKPIDVILMTDEQTNDICLMVKDYGIGIPPEDIPHVFDIFYRGRNALNYEGNGMGLHVAAICAKLHCGTLTCESEEGIGTVMTLRIPREVGAEIYIDAE